MISKRDALQTKYGTSVGKSASSQANAVVPAKMVK
jgi:hypothetical protein